MKWIFFEWLIHKWWLWCFSFSFYHVLLCYSKFTFQNYFGDAWNVFDFIIVLGSFIDIIYSEVNVSKNYWECWVLQCDVMIVMQFFIYLVYVEKFNLAFYQDKLTFHWDRLCHMGLGLVDWVKWALCAEHTHILFVLYVSSYIQNTNRVGCRNMLLYDIMQQENKYFNADDWHNLMAYLTCCYI